MAQKSNRSQLLARLRQGDLPSDEWPRWAASRKSLHIRIHNMRQDGFQIEAVPHDPRRGQRAPTVRYRLREAVNA